MPNKHDKCEHNLQIYTFFQAVDHSLEHIITTQIKALYRLRDVLVPTNNFILLILLKVTMANLSPILQGNCKL